MNSSDNTTSEDEEEYAPVDKWSKSTGFLPVTAGSNPAGSTNALRNSKLKLAEYDFENQSLATTYSKIKSYLGYWGTLVLIAWGESVDPSRRKVKCTDWST